MKEKIGLDEKQGTVQGAGTVLSAIKPNSMNRLNRFLVILAVLFVGIFLLQPFLVTKSGVADPALLDEKDRFSESVNQAVSPIPASLAIRSPYAALGSRLFYEKKLSPKNIACVDCHDLDNYGTLNQTLSANIEGGLDIMNIPTVLNAALNANFGWRGDDASILAQLNAVINNPKHMGSSWRYVVDSLNADPDYVRAFTLSFSEIPSRTNIGFAIRDFEKSLLTLNAPFDRYLNGDDKAISALQKKGYRLFEKYGCIACHQGMNIGGNLYAKYGLFENPFANKDKLSEMDLGRYSITNNNSDKHVFRVPSLRNVAKTGPYLHDGSVDNLKEMVLRMGRYQLGQKLSDDDVLAIVAFLNSLTGEMPEISGL